MPARVQECELRFRRTQDTCFEVPRGSKYPIIRYLGKSQFSAGFGQVYDYWVLGPLGVVYWDAGVVWKVCPKLLFGLDADPKPQAKARQP